MASTLSTPVNHSRLQQSLPQAVTGGVLLHLVATLPALVCLLIPYIRIYTLIPLYVVFVGWTLVVLRFPPVRLPSAFKIAWFLLFVGFVIGYFSSVARVGFGFRPLAHLVQYLLGLLYAYCLVTNVVAGKLSSKRLAGYFASGGLALAVIGLLQFVLFITNPGLAHALYWGYLRLGGCWSDYEMQYVFNPQFLKSARILGTWSVSTTYAGMVALGGTFLLLAAFSPLKKGLFFFPVGLACLISLSRHSWALCLLIVFFMLVKHGKKMMAVTGLIGVIAVVGAWVALKDRFAVAQGVAARLEARIERTRTQGWQDYSFIGRYVVGTERFINYAQQDPLMLLFGFGIRTDVGLQRRLGAASYEKESEQNWQYGFVSNSWLLIWRNCGILALVGLLIWHAAALRRHAPEILGAVMISAVIFLSDNYAADEPLTFFLLVTLMAVVWAEAICLARARAPQIAPGAAPARVPAWRFGRRRMACGRGAC